MKGAQQRAGQPAFPVEESDHLMLITNQGKTIRLPVGGHQHPAAHGTRRDPVQT